MKTNFRKLYLADQERKFTRQFWKRDLPILIACGYIGALILLCASVKILNELMK